MSPSVTYVFELKKQQLLTELKNPHLAVIVDDYTDNLHQYVANILMVLMQVSED